MRWSPWTLALITGAGFFTVVALSCAEDPPLDLPKATGGAGGAGGAGGFGPVEGILSQGPNSTRETDPQIAVNGQYIAIVWTGAQCDGPTHIGYVTSTDGGTTFTEPQKFESDDEDSYTWPDIAIDLDTTVHLSFIGHKRNGQGSDLYVASWGVGETPGEPEAVLDPDDMLVQFYGRPRVTVTNGLRVLVTFTETLNQSATLSTVTREPLGDVWTPNQLSNNNNFFPDACAEVGSMNNTYLVSVSGGRVQLRSSADDGDSWGSIDAQDVNEQGLVSGPVSCIANGTNVWVSYGVSGPDGIAAIRVALSEDSGQSIAQWGTISDPMIKPQFRLHQLALQAPTTAFGVYYNGAGKGDESASLRRVTFTPGSLMQDPPMMPDDPPLGLPSDVIAEPVVFQIEETHAQWLGESVGVAYDNGALNVVYVDNNDGNAHIAFTKVTP
jgi:hypothetical protein